MKIISFFLFIIFAVFSNVHIHSQGPGKFIVHKQLPVTPVKNQYKTSTCWSFSVLSMLESELLLQGKDTLDLSEMFIVRNVYIDKSEVYVRMHGNMKFSGGGALNDPLTVIKEHGIVPEELYNGLIKGEKNHNHHELDEVLKGYVEQVVKNEDGHLSPVWHDGFIKILDTYLGTVPKEFEYKGKKYTPKSFQEYLGINPDDYILLASFTHHPYYKPFVIEVPDNWSWGKAYNLPLDELMGVIDNSINNNYTIAWAADISEEGFNTNEGIATVTETDWEEIEANFNVDMNNKIITPEIKQMAFDNYQTQDDHGMHIYGIANDSLGEKYYLVKNSWGTKICGNEGHVYVSGQYMRYKTLSILVNKNGMPKSVLNKLELE